MDDTISLGGEDTTFPSFLAFFGFGSVLSFGLVGSDPQDDFYICNGKHTVCLSGMRATMEKGYLVGCGCWYTLGINHHQLDDSSAFEAS